ncbi:MAG: hypothetical protein CM15mP108_0810 [Gammaproteobacteria bacterium]|nr:MAG: hypothetical protein CM15mP108_0810 [Gammaproteobacteria bacterium]
MNLDYNEEQIMLREQIQKFCESEYDFYKREEVIKSDKHLMLKFGNYLLIKVGYQCHLVKNQAGLDLDQSNYQFYLRIW